MRALSGLERKQLLRSARQRGVVIQAEALSVLTEIYSTLFSPNFGKFVETLFEYFQEVSDGSDILTEETSHKLFASLLRMSKREAGEIESRLTLIDAFQVPVPLFNRSSKAYGIDENAKPTLLSGPEEKIGMFRKRFELLLQRTLRDERFHLPETHDFVDTKVRLTEIESLHTQSGRKTVLGFLTQLEEGTWFLEDLRSSIQISIKNAQFTPGIHTDGSIVLAQGEVVGSLFVVDTLGSPSAEKRLDSLAAISRCDLFGPALEDADRKLLAEKETEDGEAMILFLADVWLDTKQVLGGFKRLLQGFQESKIAPAVIVLMGDFSSPQLSATEQAVNLQSNFGALGNIIADYKEISEQTEFVIVPGPNDPGCMGVLPRESLAPFFVEEFRKYVKNVHLMSSPCRLRYYTQEIVVFREDLLQKMMRHSATRLTSEEDHTEHLVKSIVDQAHLCPLPLTSRPVLWEHDHALWLFPTPDVLVLACNQSPFVWSYNNCQAANPSRFGENCTFTVYLPSSKIVQHSSC
uniref:DNA polymerase epsilon subunit n=1 Tax=Rhodosorus marinus TaxID=101924 RepID=A0A7S3EJ80_9RHOD|mmetsp:Transcript_40271/g.159980  ORF Transcript_40271/g.159980 Transcript_40271/m.159980 type:complete len:521 (+) Transcript_40271:316-1878(+)